VVTCANNLHDTNLPKSNNDELFQSLNRISSEAQFRNIVEGPLYES
jgi:hypothetical protein